MRKGIDAGPYINHPIEVAALLAIEGGVTNQTLLVAAVLHDTIEDTRTTPQEIKKNFGSKVLALVKEVTDDKSLSKAERKRLQLEHAPHLSPSAKMIKVADKTSNVRDVAEKPPADWPLPRRWEYLSWAADVVAGCRGVNKALEHHFDKILKSAKATVQREVQDIFRIHDEDGEH